jgi:hypothetical protein
MRIPLEQTDLQHFLSRITPKLQAAWPAEQLPAGPFEDAVAKFLGYDDHFTLLDCVGEWSAFEDSPISRAGLQEAILWNAFAAGLLSYFKLLEIFPSDDLKYLAADRFTNEARKEALEEAQGSRTTNGMFYIQDEYGYYVGQGLFGNWIKETPELLDAGAPPFELALLSDGRGFTFDRLRKKFKLLPKDLDEKLATLSGYRMLTKDKRRLKFFKEHLIPEAFTGALEAVSGYDKYQDGIQLLNIGGGHRIFNDPLGGMIPYKFQRDSDRIHQAKLMIMRGEPVHFDEGFSDPCEDGCRAELESAKIDGCTISRAAHDLRVINYMTGGDSSLDSLPPPNDTFVEYGQVYIRNNAWMNKSSVPAVLHDLVADFTEKPTKDTQESFPAWSKAFHEHLLAQIDARAKQAENAVVEAYSDGLLVKLALALSQYSSVNLNEHVKAQMLDNSGASGDFDPDSRLMEENHSQRNCQRVGDLIAPMLPQFSMFTPQTLGWMYYFNANQHPNAYRANLGDDQLGPERVPSYLCSLIFALNRLSAGREVTRSDHPSMRDVMLCVEQLLILMDATKAGEALTPVQVELLETMNITEIHDEVSGFFKALESQRKNVSELNTFREKRAQMDAIRAKGIYQYVHNPVSREDTGSLTSMFRSGRKFGGTFFATQTLADFGKSKNPLADAKKTQLPGNKRTQKLARIVAARPRKPDLAALGKTIISSIRQSLGRTHIGRPSSSRGR